MSAPRRGDLVLAPRLDVLASADGTVAASRVMCMAVCRVLCEPEPDAVPFNTPPTCVTGQTTAAS
eukprot:CAMPEP_0173058380 /NCGR_PEP_ID=MMETSP1102-20130122/1316_1 /TAXON_ID=49646 /ORGANISM="Geminigera sp., Strain Caron Lab Isolate" /LENGTH=64 /DNA_ID=CAMNT_0013924105 /DNA_START=197 /DNA_END=391 /DNA_ORIENTATION=+